jgi:hypothetical protein
MEVFNAAHLAAIVLERMSRYEMRIRGPTFDKQEQSRKSKG